MLRAEISGEVVSADPVGLTVEVPHHKEGNRQPMRVRVEPDEDRSETWADILTSWPVGTRIFAAGHACQTEEAPPAVTGRPPHLVIVADQFGDTCTQLRRSDVHATAIGFIVEAEPYYAPKAQWKFTIKVMNHLQPAGHLMHLRCVLRGTEAEFVAGQHEVGDWITVEGDLREDRFAGGKMHEILVRRWWFAKSSREQRRRIRA